MAARPTWTSQHWDQPFRAKSAGCGGQKHHQLPQQSLSKVSGPTEAITPSGTATVPSLSYTAGLAFFAVGLVGFFLLFEDGSFTSLERLPD